MCFMYSFEHFYESHCSSGCLYQFSIDTIVVCMLFKTIKIIMHHSYELSVLSLIQTGDAERRGADADLPERHVPQQACVQR